MTETKPSAQASPWRRIFEEVRRGAGNRRDEYGVQGSINWLRQQMELRRANPNVVRNIIYRDKGRLEDKRALFEILDDLWRRSGNPPLEAPEIEVLLSPAAGAEVELMQLLGREKRSAYRSFVTAIRSGDHPRLLVTGRPGAGKTLLTDAIQQALEAAPRAVDKVVRLEFGPGELASGLTRLGAALGADPELLESRLVKVGAASAFAVQADAQAEVARTLLDAARSYPGSLALLLHVSQSVGGQEQLGTVPLRLNTPEVPRVRAAEWLWVSLLAPLARLPGLSMLVSMTEVPARVLQDPGGFEGPVRLNPPTLAEARRFVRARLPHLPAQEQEAVVERSGRSFEELRTITLLMEAREPLPAGPTAESPQLIEQLARLAESSPDDRLREFLTAVAVLSLPEYPDFGGELLDRLRPGAGPLTQLEAAFLDPVPGSAGTFRPFSRQLVRELRRRLVANDLGRYRELHRRAAEHYLATARDTPTGEAAVRCLHHLFEAREWRLLEEWMQGATVPQSLLRRAWEAAVQELGAGEALERLAQLISAHYVRLGAFEHPDAVEAFLVLARSHDPNLRAWTQLKRAEGAVLKGQFERAEALLRESPATADPLMEAEAALVRAGIARWRSQLDRAAALVEEEAKPRLQHTDRESPAGRLLHAKAAVWAGLIAKDRGDLEAALREFTSVPEDDDLIEARVAFQRGDVLFKLGRFDSALAQLDRAVQLAMRREALATEQTRYLSRRGTLHARRGNPAAARADFRAAREALLAEGEDRPDAPDPVEVEFWVARCDDERALALLTEGEYREAILLLTRNLEVFGRYAATFAVDARYRTARTELRLARAYLCRGTNQPYRPPYLHTVDQASAATDVQHARGLLERVERALDGWGAGGHHHELRREALLLGSLLAADPAEAVDRARVAVNGAHTPYARAEARAHLAAALLRSGDAAAALAVATEAEDALAPLLTADERGDLGLRAWAASARLQALLRRGDEAEAGRLLAERLALPEFAPHHEALLRAFGEAAETYRAGWTGVGETLAGLLGPLDVPAGPMRLPDALVAGWLNARPGPGASGAREE